MEVPPYGLSQDQMLFPMRLQKVNIAGAEDRRQKNQ
jgi:hypothetical protein